MAPAYTTKIMPADDAGIEAAAALIRAGEVVAVASETVYGLAGDATNGAAVARIYAAKGRPNFNPLIVHLADARAARRIATFNAPAERLAERFWPGPLTLVLPLSGDSGIAPLATAGLSTIALRVPAHPAMRALLAASDRPLAAPSANASGRISPTTAAHVLASLDGAIPLILDAGATGHGVESTIVAPEASALRLLRPGPITQRALEDVAGLDLHAPTSSDIVAPGQLASHYAPAKPVRLDATTAGADEWLIGFGAVRGDATLSAQGDLIEAAARLFALLHEADTTPRERIAIAPIPEEGIGVAINDRLRRAAAPRPLLVLRV